ncbi:MAG: hypothetical protein M3252_08940 [Actinomycetota bacterium]|nr:hypothetical protein [Actinomycetota bacterium]
MSTESITDSDTRLRALSVLPRSWTIQATGYLEGEETRLIAENLFHRRTHSASLDGLSEALLKDYVASLATTDLEVATEGVADLARLTVNPDRVVALTAIGLLQSWLTRMEQRLVVNAREYDGLSWAELGLLLGRSKQAVWEKYHA